MTMFLGAKAKGAETAGEELEYASVGGLRQRFPFRTLKDGPLQSQHRGRIIRSNRRRRFGQLRSGC